MVNRYVIGSCVCALLLAACGNSAKVKDAVRQKLKDPSSAQFKDTIFSADNKRACIVWNAKNSMGGYGDWDIAELINEDSEWVVKDIKGRERNCSETGFKALDAGEKAELEARLKAIEILQKVKNISSKEATELGIGGRCSRIVWDYAYASRLIAELRVRQDSGTLASMDKEIYENSLAEAKAKLDAGSCLESTSSVDPKEGQLDRTSHQLTLSFDDKAWVEIKDATQRIIFAQNNFAGTRQVVGGKPPFDLVIGNAGAVHLLYAGKAIDLAPHTKVEVARLTLH